MPFGYDKDTDYSKLIEDAVKAGDYTRAAIYEAQRNEKITGEGLSYQTSGKYQNFLPGTEKQGYENPYKAQIDEAIAALDPEEYKRYYLGEADRTMKNTLGAYSGMTGGIPSTAAVAAASQQADYQKSQLGSKLADMNAQRASLLMNAGNLDANNYQMNIQNALNRWTMLGYADNETAGILGVPIGTTTADQAYTKWKQAQAETKSTKTTGGSGGKTIDWKKRQEIAASYESGGLDAIGSELAYLQEAGYDVDGLLRWLGAYYEAPTEKIETGYTGKGYASGGYGGTWRQETK